MDAGFRRYILGMAILASVAGLFGCNVHKPIERLPPTLILEAYSATGELQSTRVIDGRDLVYQRLALFLDRDSNRWTRSTASYATGPYILRGESVVIRCYSGMLVVDRWGSGESASFQARVPNLLEYLGLDPTTRIEAP